MLLFSPAPSVDCNWDGKLWVTLSLHVILQKQLQWGKFLFDQARRSHIKIYQLHIAMHKQSAEFFLLLILTPHLHYLHTHTHTTSTKHLYHCSALKIAPPGA